MAAISASWCCSRTTTDQGSAVLPSDLICAAIVDLLESTIQERVVETFHFALRPAASCSSARPSPGRGQRPVRALRQQCPRLREPVVDDASRHAGRPGPLNLAILRCVRNSAARARSPADLHQRLLEQYHPPSIIVTEDYNVVHMSDGPAAIANARGEPSRDVMMLSSRAQTRPAHRALSYQERRPSTSAASRCDRPRSHRLAFPSSRCCGRDPARGFFLVTSTTTWPPIWKPRLSRRSRSEPGRTGDAPARRDLARIKARFAPRWSSTRPRPRKRKRRTKKLQAMNEELRSAAEELERARELPVGQRGADHRQSRAKIKIEELGLTNNDFQNFITRRISAPFSWTGCCA